MARGDTTRWTLIRSAAEGDSSAREEFAKLYQPVIRAYFGARWRQSVLLDELDDAAQEAFLACFKAKGALQRVDAERSGGFRAYLYGVAKNVARRFEERLARRARQPDSRIDLGDVEGREEPLSAAFDRAWAKSQLRQAIDLLGMRARENGDGAHRRVDLLRLRFREGLPIREIARLWEADPTQLHREYARARREFLVALKDVVRDHLPSRAMNVDAECARLADYIR